MTVTIENTNVDTTLNIAELTTASLTGTGVFDVLLQTLRLHLDREFTSGRITGTAYATVYSQALTAVLQQSVGFCLSKTKLALELQQMQEQVVLLQKQQDQITATIRQTDYITDYQLPAETSLKAKELDIRSYELTNIKPVELALAQEDLLLKQEQVALATYDVTYIKPQELALMTQQVATQLYTVQTRLPAEVAQVVAQTSHITKQELGTIQQTVNLTSQQAQIEAETAQVVYKTTYVVPEEVKIHQFTQDRILAEVNKLSNETVVSIKQGRLVDAQVAQTTYTTANLIPKQVLQLQSQIDMADSQTGLYTQKIATELAQTTTTPASGSVMGVQNDLMATQKASYLRDAEQKASKMLIDTWNVRRNADPTSNPVSATNRLRDDDIGGAVGKMLTGIGVV